MALVGLLFAHHGAVGSAEPMAALEIAGLASVVRQIHLLRSLDVARIYIFAERMPPGLAAALSGLDEDVKIVRDPSLLAGELADGDRVFVIEEGVLADAAAAAPLLESQAPTALAVWRQEPLFAHAERLDSGSFWASLAIYDARLVRTIAEDLGEWDLQSTLLRASAGAGAARIDAGRASEHWTAVRNEHDAQQATEALIGAARAEARDWPTRFLHRPVEAPLVRLLLNTRATASLVLGLSVVCSLVAILAFAAGWLWAGLLLGLLSIPADDLAERLARIRLERPRATGPWRRLIDGIRYGWYPALAYHLAGSTGDSGPWLASAMIVLFMLAVDRQRPSCGHLLERAPDVERRLLLLGAGPTTLMWTLVPFALAGAWYAGLVALAAYSAATFFSVQHQTLARLRA